MAKTILSLTVVLLILFVGASSAGAQTSISFGNGGSSSDQVTFIANSGGAALDLGTCTVVSSVDTCTLSGPNVPGSGTYLFTTTEAGTADIQVGAFIGSSLNRSVSMGGAATAFTFTSSSGNLSGSVVWDKVITDGQAILSGTLTISSSTLSGALGPGAVNSQVNIDITTVKGPDLSTTIFNASPGTTEGLALSSGEVAATPEPSSMLLFGSGLLMAGGILRRRLTLQA